MTEITRLLDQLRRAYDGEAWSGPSLRATVAGLTAAQARSRPLANAHSIWEIVLHLTTWLTVVQRRLEENKLVGPTDAQNWPALPPLTDEAAWQQALADLHQAHAQLLARVGQLQAADLDQQPAAADYAPSTPGSYYVLLHGLVQHNLYHAGQIALLRKAFA